MLRECLALLVLCAAVAQIQGVEDLKAIAENKVKIAKELKEDYEKLVQPGNTTLKIGVTFFCARYDVKENILHSRVIERYVWQDWRLRWDPSKFGGVKNIRIPANFIWHPHDVRLNNAFPDSPDRDDVNVIVLSDGTVHWVPSASYRTLCGDGEKPNDKKGHCHISLGSWTYDAEDLPVELHDRAVSTEAYLDDCPHVISNLTYTIKESKYDCCPNPFASLEIEFDLQERAELKPEESSEDAHHGHQHHRGDRRKSARSQKIDWKRIDCKWPNC